MGRKRKPTFLHLINGNPGKRPLPKAEPIATGNLAEAPAWLTASQREGWNYAIASAPAGLLKMIDCGALVVWVIAEDCHRQAAEAVARLGMLVKTPGAGAPMQSPYMAIKNKQAAIMLRACSALGFSPTARPAITMPAPDNPFDRNGRPPA